jgi:tripartite-type tricarboxylate transporter receptor subunit TctC
VLQGLHMKRRTFLHLASGTAVLSVVSPSAWGQAYPSRPVHIVVDLPAGNAPDTVARLISQGLSDRLGRQFVVDNRPGAGGTIGTESVVRAPADGYTLLLVTTSAFTTGTLFPNLKFDFVQDIAPVASIGRTRYVMVVTPSFPARTLPEFISYAKANPGKINMASPGVGSTPHVIGALFQMMAGIELVHVPYRGSFMADLLAGQVQLAFTPTTLSIEHIHSGKLRAMAVTSPARLGMLPDVPAVSEFLTGYEAGGWNGIGAPKGTAAAIIEKLNTAINSVVADPNTKGRLLDLGIEPTSMTPAEFGKITADETEKWAKVIKFAGVKAE